MLVEHSQDKMQLIAHSPQGCSQPHEVFPMNNQRARCWTVAHHIGIARRRVGKISSICSIGGSQECQCSGH